MSSDGGYSMPTGGYGMAAAAYGTPMGGSVGYSSYNGSNYGSYSYSNYGSYRGGYGNNYVRGGYGNNYGNNNGNNYYGMDDGAGYYGAYNAPRQVIQKPPPGYDYGRRPPPGYGGGTPATVLMRQGQVPAQSNAGAQPSPDGLELSPDECAKLVRNASSSWCHK